MSDNWKRMNWTWVLLTDRQSGGLSWTWHIGLGGETMCEREFQQQEIRAERGKSYVPTPVARCPICMKELETDEVPDGYSRDRFNTYGGMGYHMVPHHPRHDHKPIVWTPQPTRPPEPELPPVVHKGRLAVVGTVRRRSGETLYVAGNGMLYRRQTGSLTAWVPCNERFAKEWGFNDKKMALLEQWDRTKCPPDWALYHLHHQLFGKYDHEVMVLNGIDEHGGWVFGVPKQYVSGGEADMETDEQQLATEMQSANIDIVGITHCHPGKGTGYSGTDDVLFRKTPGIHPILSADGTIASIHGSVMGFVWTLERDRDLTQAVPTEDQQIRFMYSGGRSLDELLARRTYPTSQWHGYGSQQKPGSEVKYYDLKEWDLQFNQKPDYKPTNNHKPARQEPSGPNKRTRKAIRKFGITAAQLIVLKVPGTEQRIVCSTQDFGEIPGEVDYRATAEVERILRGA